MGQYYTAVVENENGKVAQYTYGMKLMEHSWWKNTHMGAICKMIYKIKSKVCWVGDYASEDDDWENEEQKSAWYGVAWRYSDNNEPKLTEGNADGILLDGKFLVNHTQKIYINCDEYHKRNDRDGRCIHPLSLLTAKGNGRGSGDYHERYPDFDSVGSWALDEISVEDDKPKDYDEVMYEFVEE